MTNSEMVKATWFETPKNAQISVKRIWEAISQSKEAYTGLGWFWEQVQNSSLKGMTLEQFKPVATKASEFLKSANDDFFS